MKGEGNPQKQRANKASKEEKNKKKARKIITITFLRLRPHLFLRIKSAKIFLIPRDNTVSPEPSCFCISVYALYSSSRFSCIFKFPLLFITLLFFFGGGVEEGGRGRGGERDGVEEIPFQFRLAFRTRSRCISFPFFKYLFAFFFIQFNFMLFLNFFLWFVLFSSPLFGFFRRLD